MELRHLRYFMAVATERSFTRAAEVLHISQPPLSRQIRELETEIGSPLFVRNTRNVSMTEAGRLFHDQAAQILARVDELKHMMARFADAERRRFVIGCVGSTIYGTLPMQFRRFRAEFPELDVELSEMTTLEQIAALKAGRIDVGFGRLNFDDPAIRFEVLMRERLIVALPMNHALALRTDAIDIEALAAEPLILYPRMPRPSYADQILRIFNERGFRPKIVHEVRELQTALGLVAADAGVCIVPSAMHRLQRDDVVYRELTDPTVTSPIIMSTRIADESRELLWFLDMSREMARSSTDGDAAP
ncbi:LysR family transcriptional regulator [Sphingopyxis sp.]|uniref:LysR family transcriptional regulator n=1 Tax=Sphingopyxis sp. TaxID=1908224 RepID=UPI0025E5BBB4|nr:LysR family transcriptional regulator [Sphingopyxis sp.]MBK6411677.1 LysR family transcriptional regulator [Sphingopyxis sp.]